MVIVLNLILCVAGILLLLKPEYLWKLEQWKYKGEGEPSDLFLASTRFGGGVLVFLSVVLAVMLCCE